MDLHPPRERLRDRVELIRDEEEAAEDRERDRDRGDRCHRDQAVPADVHRRLAGEETETPNAHPAPPSARVSASLPGAAATASRPCGSCPATGRVRPGRPRTPPPAAAAGPRSRGRGWRRGPWFPSD